ncbi:unnamed protein product [Rotaria sordida]|uniref:Uncharacterized protein n=1 Tax=Rotaria sordida TaxID=392033 RepID=A0A819TGF4_9BILA|nr:unnamed protein product [Rotaria sordida]CAF1401269.1 unnamed protein product [Rotaria sordida]CAF1611625.1 unnamed protein product [Rotaria sordida]CAF4065113.1 unnamed protein product [Rotaria sordida]
MPLVSVEEAVALLVTILPDIRRKTWIAKVHVGEAPTDELSTDESASICLYSMEWEPRDECLYHRLNTTLRDENRERLKPWFLYLKRILTALA